MLVGREGWTLDGIADLRAFAEAWQLPTIATVRAQDMLDNHAPTYVGYLGVGANPALLARVKAADCLLVVGSRLDGLSTAGYSLVSSPRPQQTMIHVYPDPDELGRIYQADLLINATLPEFAAAARALPPLDSHRWTAWREAARLEYKAYCQVTPSPGEVNLGEIVAYTRRRLPPEAITTTGAGNYTAWVARFFDFTLPRTQLAPISGAMGYGVPASVTAKLLHRDRPVVSFAGDGCFLMNGQELATAVRYNLGIIFIVVNNEMYGTIRMHQERQFPAHVHGTSLTNPNFAEYARAFGAQGAVVERTEDFANAFEQALAANRPTLIEVRVSPEAILPSQTLSQLRSGAMKLRSF
jgi:acetolactate synthase-1/2/3 large subunit